MRTITKIFLVITVFAFSSITLCAQTQVSDANGSVTTIVTSVSGQYDILLEQETQLNDEINSIQSQIPTAKKSQVKRLQKELDKHKAEIEVIQRKKATFPESVRNPQTVQKKSDSKFLEQLDTDAQLKAQNSDPFSEAISGDPEVERVYREYLSGCGYVPIYDRATGECVSDAISSELSYRIMLSIEKFPLPTSMFEGMDDVLEQRMKDGTMIYYQGNYSTEDEAKKACVNIKKTPKFRDAFVVAMRGAQRVEL